MVGDFEHADGRYFGNTTQIILFVIGCALITFSFSSLIFIIYALYHHDRKKQNNQLARSKSIFLKDKWKNIKSVPYVNYPTISSALFYFLSTCSYISALFYFDDADADNFGHDLHFVVAMVTFVTFIFAAKTSIYTQFLARLYSAFAGSYLEPSKCTIRLCITLLILSWCTIIWWLALLSLRYLIFQHNFAGYYTQFYFVFSFLLLFDFTVSWLVVGLFTQKLFSTVMLKDRQLDLAQSATPNIRHIIKNSMDETDERRLDLITKQVILSSIAISTSQLVYISLLIILIIKDTKGYPDNVQPKLYSLYAGALYPMDVFLNCIILYLNYKFGDKYYLFLCCCCHRTCKGFALKHITKQIGRKFSQERDQYVMMSDI